jgi:nicotinamidase-related amidase
MIYTIDPQKTALLIIDPQREYYDEGRPLYTPHAQEILPNLQKLRETLAALGVRTIFVRHVHNADGTDIGRMGDFDPTPLFVEGTPEVEIVADLAPGEGDVTIEKTRYSAFVNTKLESILKTFGVDTVIITGLMTNFCCVTTARHAHDLDYKVIFVSDANAGPDMPDLGFGEVPHAEIMRSVATSLAGGVADVVATADLVQTVHQAAL